jgi:hypothetical protein
LKPAPTGIDQGTSARSFAAADVKPREVRRY